MDYEKLYKDRLERAKHYYKENKSAVIPAIFPELKESEDERIRKAIVNHLLELSKSRVNIMTKETYENWIAWLEKQGEQKFEELPNGEDYGIDSLYHAARILEKTLGEVKGYQSDDGILEHECAINEVVRLREYLSKMPAEVKQTKENLIEYLQKQRDASNFGGDVVTFQTWIDLLSTTLNRISSVEQKTTWSKEDERMRKSIIDDLIYYKGGPNSAMKEIHWLKSLKERYTWKPSDEQMDTLQHAIVYVEGCNSNFKGGGSVLEKLYNDLMRLREE